MEHLPEPSREAAERALAQELTQQQDVNSRPMLRRLSILVDLGQRTRTCDSHGEFVETGRRLGNGTREIWSGCKACAEETRAAEVQAVQAAEQQRLQERRNGEIEAAAIPPRFRTRTFDNFFADTPGKLRARSVARDYAEQFPEMSRRGLGLIFSGMPGTGKSHLAAAIMLALINGQRSVQYITCMALIRAVRETWRRDSEDRERRVIAEFGKHIDLLVIDEVGVQYGTDGEQTILFEILDRRYCEMRPTILLTNQDKAGLKTFVGDRVMDRLAETCRWVPFDWESYRPTARKESQA